MHFFKKSSVFGLQIYTIRLALLWSLTINIRILPAPIINYTKWVWCDEINFHSMVFLLLFSITFYILLHFVKSVQFISYNFGLIAQFLDTLKEKMHLWKSLEKLIIEYIHNGNKSVPNTQSFLNQSIV